MTVQDILAASVDYQDFQLAILSFGDNRKLFSEYINDCYYYEGNKYAEKKVAAIKFGNERLTLILEPGEDK